MIGGMYLGDIVRRVILRMSQESDIFGPISSILSTPFVLRYISFCLLLYLFQLKKEPDFYGFFGEFSMLKIPGSSSYQLYFMQCKFLCLSIHICINQILLQSQNKFCLSNARR